MRIKLTPGGCIPQAQALKHIHAARARKLPIVKGSGRLALVGGGLSAAEHVQELREWDGEVWAINGAARWCHEHGIDAALVTVHPTITEIAPFIKRVVLGVECAPELFDACADRDLRVLPDVEINGEMQRGGTTATSVALALPYMGFMDLTFFGLEGSYGLVRTADMALGRPRFFQNEAQVLQFIDELQHREWKTHLYEVFQDPSELWLFVKCSGELFRTKLEFLHQSVLLAELVHKYPIYEERSGGLLRALVNDHEFDVIDGAPVLLDEIEKGLRDGDSVIVHC